MHRQPQFAGWIISAQLQIRCWCAPYSSLHLATCCLFLYSIKTLGKNIINWPFPVMPVVQPLTWNCSTLKANECTDGKCSFCISSKLQLWYIGHNPFQHLSISVCPIICIFLTFLDPEHIINMYSFKPVLCFSLCRSWRSVSVLTDESWFLWSSRCWLPWRWDFTSPRAKSCHTTAGWCSRVILEMVVFDTPGVLLITSASMCVWVDRPVYKLWCSKQIILVLFIFCQSWLESVAVYDN